MLLSDFEKLTKGRSNKPNLKGRRQTAAALAASAFSGVIDGEGIVLACENTTRKCFDFATEKGLKSGF